MERETVPPVARNSLMMGRSLALALLFSVVACHSSSSTPIAALPAPAKTIEAVAPPSAWVKPSKAELEKSLTKLQFEVTQNDETEPPFHNEYWDNHAAGIYVDVATGEPLFSSLDKFESGTGWPSFTRPIEASRVVSTTDETLGMTRTEVRSNIGSSHLGHVFDDGPAPTGLRYCINSASLRFIPADRLAQDGYASNAPRFTTGVASPLAAATNNACAKPKLGEHAGCAATLETLTLGAGAHVEALRSVAGVIEVDTESDGVHVLFDPKKSSRADLIAKSTL